MTSISLIIPAYNEAKRLPLALNSLADFFAGAQLNLQEVIIVDDGSSDETVAVASSFSEHLPIKVLRLDANYGKGYAVKRGVEAAVGELIIMYDADGATLPTSLTPLIEASADCPIVIGSRVLSKQVQISFWRRLVGFIFHLLCFPLIPGIKDASCGAKVFRYGVAQAIFKETRLKRFAFDIEVLWLARQKGYEIKELPVAWQERPGSKVKVGRDAPEMFLAILGLYFRALLVKIKL